MNDAALLDLARALCDGGYAFVTPTPATHARVNARPTNLQASDAAGVFGWSRPFHDAALPPRLLALAHAAGILVPGSDGAPDGWRSTLRLSSLDGMAFWHSAYPTGQENAVFFGPDTYRFAACLSVWLDRAERPVRRAVDIGCGAGPGALVVARARPAASVFGVDINDDALRLADVNARLNGAGRVPMLHSDLLGGLDGAFDLIVSNPPYLADPARRAYRHGGGALGEGLSLAIVDAAVERLAPGGTLLLYTGSAIVDGHDAFRAAAAARLAGTALDWTYREVDPDVFGEELESGPYVDADRIAAVMLTASRRD